MRVIFDRTFKKNLNKAPANIQQAFHTRLDLFLSNPYHPLLRNHALKGLYQNCRSINITGDWRAIYTEIDDGAIAFFIQFGTHSQLYK